MWFSIVLYLVGKAVMIKSIIALNSENEFNDGDHWKCKADTTLTPLQWTVTILSVIDILTFQHRCRLLAGRDENDEWENE